MTGSLASSSTVSGLESLTWSLEMADESLNCLLEARGFESIETEVSGTVAALPETEEELGRRLQFVAQRHGAEVREISGDYREVGDVLRSAAPMLVLLPAVSLRRRRLLLISSSKGGRLKVLLPLGGHGYILAKQLRALLVEPLESGVKGRVESLLDAAGVHRRMRRRAERVLFQQELVDAKVSGVWLVRALPSSPLSSARLRRVGRGLIGLGLAYLLQFAVLGFAWSQVAKGGLFGTRDAGHLSGWLLAVVTAIPLRAMTAWCSVRFSMEASVWFRNRILAGVLELDPRSLRKLGTGRLLGHVLEAATLESLGLGGALTAALALLDLGVVALLLSALPNSGLILVLFTGVLCCAVALAVGDYHLRFAWTRSRTLLTQELIENLMGHRTRIVQQKPGDWHTREDVQLQEYFVRSRNLNMYGTVSAMLPHVWLVGGFVLVSLRLLSSSVGSGISVGLMLGGILLGQGSLAKVMGAMGQLSQAWIAWRQIGPDLFPKGERSSPQIAREPFVSPREGAAVSVRQLELRVPGRSEALLSAVDLKIKQGDRILLEGPSGCGKSTLARHLAGFENSAKGLTLLGGLDAATLGRRAWRQGVNLVPQFHENYLLSGPLAFNLLLGGVWPPSSKDLKLAEQVCRELGLGPLLERMPAGMMQAVGETGWRLSHGEQSRIFAARAILADPALIILDESLAALDADTAQRVLDCLEKRARALLVIAHP